MKKKKLRRWGIFIFLLIFGIITVIQNKNLVLTSYEITSDKLATEDELVIVQLSDIHFIKDSAQAEKLLKLTRSAAPDLIALTGDLIDTPMYTEQKSALASGQRAEPIGQETIDFCEELAKLAPCYLVYGNHEMSFLDDPKKNAFMLSLQGVGVKIINNTAQEVELGGVRVNLLGVQDPSTLYKDPVYAHKELSNRDKVGVILDDLTAGLDTSRFTLVLSHRPEYFELYREYSLDLLLAGHAHGGQFRLPLVREGLVAPGQGFFPDYTVGVYKEGDFCMIVSRGIGNSIIPVRIFNTPEVVKVTVRGE